MFFAAESDIYFMCTVGIYFQVLHFKRSNFLDINKTLTRQEMRALPVNARWSASYHLLNEGKTDYHKNYKSWWSRVNAERSGEVPSRSRHNMVTRSAVRNT